jgi:hypothetical protein
MIINLGVRYCKLGSVSKRGVLAFLGRDYWGRWDVAVFAPSEHVPWQAPRWGQQMIG